MLDYGKRLLIVLIVAAFIGMLFIGGTASRAAGIDMPKDWIWPANGEISDHFGSRDGAHKGVDIAGEYLSPVVAAEAGIVSKSYSSDTYGQVIFIRHTGEAYETVYAHLQNRLVGEGQKIKKGQLIGKMGNTGDSDGVHLHFELHKKQWTFDKKNAVDPLLVLDTGQLEDQTIAVMKQQEETSPKTYIVREGDTLGSISRKFSTSVDKLVSLNRLKSDLIHANQVLLLR
ncbi:peptidoglycan DD-metalloendopeptidase family protein [Bacillus sp. 1P06AnD]|uniref:peptidoglycan DD-metalloendopeptidase family protein n=1 Tax=Bacillus sp. 1P06AnD TaxID=3132208 RepID=UPI00399F4D6C